MAGYKEDPALKGIHKAILSKKLKTKLKGAEPYVSEKGISSYNSKFDEGSVVSAKMPESMSDSKHKLIGATVGKISENKEVPSDLSKSIMKKKLKKQMLDSGKMYSTEEWEKVK